MKTDILDYLHSVVEENTVAYKTDFSYDIEKLTASANEPDAAERSFLWLSRPHGTWCLKERNVFLKGTTEHSIWTHYDTEHTGFRAFWVQAERLEGERLTGKVIPIDYAESLRRVKAFALPAAYVKGSYADGVTFELPYAEYSGSKHRNVIREHGGVQSIRYCPESEAELRSLMRLEHSLQTQRPRRTTAKAKTR